MSTRRRHLAGLGLAAAGVTLGAAAGASPASAAPLPVEPFPLVARRTKITLPELPTLGLTYITMLDLFDASGARVGQAFTGSSVVEVTLEGPIVLASVTLRLPDGEIVYQRVMNRFGPYPRASTGAILGGTGLYQGLDGEVQISWPNADRVDLIVQPLPAAR